MKVPHSAIGKIAEEYGIPIVEPKKHMEIVLTRRQIANSSMKDPTSCAFAKACAQKDNVVAAYFFQTVAYVQYKDRLERYFLPPSMVKEILAFDRGGPKAMEAGIYRLSPVRKTHRLVEQRKRSRDPNRKRAMTGTRQKHHRSTNVRKRTF